MNHRQIIQNVPLFAGLAEDDLDALMNIVRIREHARGELLFSEGEEAEGFYVVIDGKVKVYKLSPEGKERILHVIHPGGTFAEAIMFAKQPAYPVSAVAITASRVLCFSAPTYIDILRDCTEACFAVMAQMSRRLHGHIAEIDRLTLHSATFRVVCYLLDQVPSTHLGVPEVKLDTPAKSFLFWMELRPRSA